MKTDFKKEILTCFGGAFLIMFMIGVYFVYLPSYHRYNKLIKDNNYNDFIFIKNSMRDLNIPFIDLHTDLISKNPKAYFPFGLAGHYNENGYKEVGKFLFEKTKE